MLLYTKILSSIDTITVSVNYPEYNSDSKRVGMLSKI